MKLFLIMLSLAFSVGLCAQNTESGIHANGIYQSDSDYMKHNLTQGFEKTKTSKLLDNSSHFISIKTDSVVYKFYFDEIWGYRKDGIDWRIYNGEYYRVDYVGKVSIYSLSEGMPGNTNQFLYFSSNLNAPIHSVSRKNLTDVFHSNSTFIGKLKKFPVTKSLTKWDKKNKCYRFVAWL